MSILILGLGNLLMTDDALGSRCVAELEKRFVFPESVTLLDGGTLGLDLLPRLEPVDRLLVIDALQMKAEPGTLFRLHGDEVPRAFANKLSVHQMGLQDLLAVAELQGILPSQLVVLGVQAESIEMGLEMSSPVEAALPRLLDAVAAELLAWGVDVSLAA
ncbi:hydrogenase maturation protease [Malonomonas rubra DSM 5091]|uniref:Hydrogenase maturation protease n=1 Tax=Malonomonas rubra DSM 5091 TaxID=1122189 RepID=A0A1M6JXB1_MALRU|nr:HyaD/HybD family hydrogenase maturation endopeptidase [Malonomonas rubra]SHJ51334.1 hydrogenase maturation protease [Malonomonas rubra DSM 5091]